MALLDTGFSDQLIIPSTAVLEADGVVPEPDDWIDARVADGRSVPAPLYFGAIELPDLAPVDGVCIIVMGDQYIIGRGIIDLFKVTLDHGERLIIEP